MNVKNRTELARTGKVTVYTLFEEVNVVIHRETVGR